MDNGLIGAPALQIVVAKQVDVFALGLLLSRSGGQKKSRERAAKDQNHCPSFSRPISSQHRSSNSKSGPTPVHTSKLWCGVYTRLPRVFDKDEAPILSSSKDRHVRIVI